MRIKFHYHLLNSKGEPIEERQIEVKTDTTMTEWDIDMLKTVGNGFVPFVSDPGGPQLRLAQIDLLDQVTEIPIG